MQHSQYNLGALKTWKAKARARVTWRGVTQPHQVTSLWIPSSGSFNFQAPFHTISSHLHVIHTAQSGSDQKAVDHVSSEEISMRT